MRCKMLGWAGVELDCEGETLVIDVLAEPAAVFAALGDAAAAVALPEVVAPSGEAAAGLVTHLHRDHADAHALVAALAPGAPVLAPVSEGAEEQEPALAQAAYELNQAGLSARRMAAWDTVTIGPFEITALPAADGTGDPQLSWAVAAGGRRIVHCGDTLFHGWWWRMAQAAGPFDAAFLPINAAAVAFPWRRPASRLPAVMSPEEAAQAARALGARLAVPMHHGAFDIEPYYRSAADALERFELAAREAGLEIAGLRAGEQLEL